MMLHGIKVRLRYFSLFLILTFYCCCSFSQTRNKDYKVTLDTISRKIQIDSIQRRLDDILIKDQAIRQIYSCFKEKYPDNSAEMKFYWELLKEQDSLNLKTVTNILNDYGWLGISEIGVNANKAIFLVIQHGSLQMQEKFLPLLEKSVNKKESSGEYYALLVDRILVKNGCEQEFGTQIKVNSETGKYELYPIRNPEKVDMRRNNLGLKPLENYLKYYGIQLKDFY